MDIDTFSGRQTFGICFDGPATRVREQATWAYPHKDGYAIEISVPWPLRIAETRKGKRRVGLLVGVPTPSLTFTLHIGASGEFLIDKVEETSCLTLHHLSPTQDEGERLPSETVTVLEHMQNAVRLLEASDIPGQPWNKQHYLRQHCTQTLMYTHSLAMARWAEELKIPVIYRLPPEEAMVNGVTPPFLHATARQTPTTILRITAPFRFVTDKMNLDQIHAHILGTPCPHSEEKVATTCALLNAQSRSRGLNITEYDLAVMGRSKQIVISDFVKRLRPLFGQAHLLGEVTEILNELQERPSLIRGVASTMAGGRATFSSPVKKGEKWEVTATIQGNKGSFVATAAAPNEHLARTEACYQILCNFFGVSGHQLTSSGKTKQEMVADFERKLRPLIGKSEAQVGAVNILTELQEQSSIIKGVTGALLGGKPTFSEPKRYEEKWQVACVVNGQRGLYKAAATASSIPLARQKACYEILRQVFGLTNVVKEITLS